MLQSHEVIIESDFAPAETKHNIWCATIKHTIKPANIFDSKFFGNIASKLTVGDKIECYAEDGTYYIVVMVIAVDERTPTHNPSWANVVELQRVDLVRPEDKGLKLPDGFTAKFRGGAKWSVIRKGATEGEDQVIVEKQNTKADAIREFEKMKNKLVA